MRFLTYGEGMKESVKVKMIDELDNPYKKAKRLRNLLVSRAKGRASQDEKYLELCQYFFDNSEMKKKLPAFLEDTSGLDSFWDYIQGEFPHYEERTKFIRAEFEPLLDYCKNITSVPSDSRISASLKSFDEAGVHVAWKKALARRTDDPEGAITAARTLLETVCKRILSEREVVYDSGKVTLHILYSLTAKELNLHPNQHNEEIFKKILGGCSAIVSGLGELRNKLGDAHAENEMLSNPSARPVPRHAEFAVNLAGSVALFLVETYKNSL